MDTGFDTVKPTLRVKTLKELKRDFEFFELSNEWRTENTFFIEAMLPFCGQPVPVTEELYKLMLGLERLQLLFPGCNYWFDVSMLTNIEEDGE